MTSWNLRIITLAACMMAITVGSADETTKELFITTEQHEHHQSTVPTTISTHFAMDTSCSDFLIIRNLPAYVDKSLLIKAVLKNAATNILITAPPRFGKSVNLSMMKRYFEILPNQTVQRANRELFKGLQIEKEKNIMNEHCGKYPVIFLNFKSEDRLKSYDEARQLLCGIVQQAYDEHKYLAYSDKLEDSARKYVKNCCDLYSRKIPDETKSLIFNALRDLTKYLVQHYGRNVIVLVDDYDSIATSAMMGTKTEEDLEEIIEFTIASLSVLTESNMYVDRVIMTGISYIAMMGLSKLNSVKAFKFQEENCFSQYYSLTKEECKELMIRFNVQSHYDEVVEYYDGYRGNTLSIWSVMNYLNDMEVANYWIESGVPYNLYNAFQYTTIRSIILTLLSETNNVYEVRIVEKFNCTDLYHLKKIFEDPRCDKIEPEYVNLLFLFLLEQGYLAIVEVDKSSEIIKIKIPNREIEQDFIYWYRKTPETFLYEM